MNNKTSLDRLKDFVKEILFNYNPLNIARREKMRERLINTTPTLLVPNCLGGILFHDLGLQFRSPTVNLMMYQTDFVKFCCNLDEYLSSELQFFQHPEYQFPCAHLGKDPVTIHFTHYDSIDDAKEKWFRRKERINRDNLFICCLERDGITVEQMKALKETKARGIVVFTAHDYPDIPYACHVPKTSKDGRVIGFLWESRLDGHKTYEKFFDFVKWFNESDGKNYDITPYMK